MRFYLLAAALAIVAGAPRAYSDDITTPSGKTYRNYTVTRVDPDGLHIVYDGGCGKVMFEQLPPALRKKYGYDPAAAAAFLTQQSQKAAPSDTTRTPTTVAANARMEQVEPKPPAINSAPQAQSAAPAPVDRQAILDKIASIDDQIQNLNQDLALASRELKQETNLTGDRIASHGGSQAQVFSDKAAISELTSMKDQLQLQLRGN